MLDPRNKLYHEKLRLLPYSTTELKHDPDELFSHHTRPSEIQRQIEYTVTNGRGYLSLGQALQVVNMDQVKLTLAEVLSSGIAPICFEKRDNKKDKNPCGEIPFGEPEESTSGIYQTHRLPSLIERLRTMQYIKLDKICRERHCIP